MSQQPSTNKGWVVTLAALCANLVLGSLYAWPVMGKALQETMGWTRAQANLPFTASTIAFAISMIFAGRLQDKLGPRLAVSLGGLMLGTGFVLSAWAHKPSLLMITFGIIGGIGIGLGYSGTTPPAIKWFPPQKKGLISGIVVSGVGLAAVIMAPITRTLLAKTGGIPTTFIILGAGTIIFVGLMALLLSNPPKGYTPTAAKPAAKAARKPAPSASRDVDWAEMLQTAAFWKLWIVMILGASAGLMIIGQIPNIIKSQAGIANPTKFIMFVAIANTCGRLISGVVSDKLGRTNTIALFFSLQAVNMLCFPLYTTESLLMFGAIFAGLCYGPIFPLFPSATADFYGLKNLGVNYGLVFTAFGVAGTLGPQVSAAIADKNGGSYHQAFLLCAALLVMGVVLAFFTKAPRSASAPVAAQPQTAK